MGIEIIPNYLGFRVMQMVVMLFLDSEDRGGVLVAGVYGSGFLGLQASMAVQGDREVVKTQVPCRSTKDLLQRAQRVRLRKIECIGNMNTKP